MSIEKRPDENQYEYHKRIINGKMEDKSLADIDYSELSEAAYGQAYSSDTVRKMFYGSKKTIDLIESMREQSLSSCPSEMIAEIEDRRIELAKESQRLYDQRRELKSMIRVEGRSEHIYSTLERVAESMQNDLGYPISRNRDIEMAMYNEDDDGCDAVLVLSDWHYGMKADNVFNTFSTDICQKRVSEIIGLAKKRIHLHRCKRLYIIVLGDLYHGAIHVGVRVASEEAVCEQLMHSSELLAQAIAELSECVSSTHVYVTYGNHARTVANKKESLHEDNMERIVPWWLKQRLKDYDDIHIESYDNSSDKEFMLINVRGHIMCAAHGDLDAVRSSPRLLNTLFQKIRGHGVDYILLGDKHHRESFDELGTTAIICGSLCGADDYSNSKRLYSSPSQMMLIVNDQCGVDAEYILKCKEGCSLYC